MNILNNISRIDITLNDKISVLQIGAGILRNPAAVLPFPLTGRKIFIITDDNVRGLVTEKFAQAIGGQTHILSLPVGEKTKSFAEYQRVINFLLDHQVDRQSVLVAVGGGVVGDLAGFAAATILRGIKFVQVPTTLLAQVDSSVGGKNGINTSHGKNLVGTFYQPDVVLIDSDVLSTLPAREFAAGYAEIYKYGLILNADFVSWLEQNVHLIFKQDKTALHYAIAQSCQMKAHIVQQDAREENDKRALLNLGHTFGHALEVLNGYSAQLLHGEAVAIGMVLALRLSAKLGYVQADDVARVKTHLQAAQLPTEIADIAGFKANMDDMMARMRLDKKAAAGQMAFVLCEKIGQAIVKRDVPEDVVRSIL